MPAITQVKQNGVVIGSGHETAGYAHLEETMAAYCHGRGVWKYQPDCGILRDAATNEAFSAYVLADDISRNASVTDVEAVDLVYAYILTLIEDDHWSLLTPFFDGFHVATAPVVVMLAPLTITVDCRARISERRRYFDRVAGELVRRREPQILELLQGLE